MMERCRPENFYTTTAKNHLSCAKQRGRYYYIYRHYITRQTMNTQHTHITIYIAHTQRKWMEDLYLQQQEIRRPQKSCESCLDHHIDPVKVNAQAARMNNLYGCIHISTADVLDNNSSVHINEIIVIYNSRSL